MVNEQRERSNSKSKDNRKVGCKCERVNLYTHDPHQESNDRTPPPCPAHSQTLQAHSPPTFITESCPRTRYSDPNKTSFAVDSDFTNASTITVAPVSGADYIHASDARSASIRLTPNITYNYGTDTERAHRAAHQEWLEPSGC